MPPPDPTQDPVPRPAVVAHLVRKLLRYRSRVIGALALAVMVSALSGITVGALVPILDVVLATGEELGESVAFLREAGPLGDAAADGVLAFAAGDRMRLLWAVLGGLVGAVVLKGIFKFLHEYTVVSTCQRAQLDMAEDLFDRLTAHDESTLARVGMSNLTSRFSYDLDITGKALETLAGTLVLEPLNFLFLLGLALALSWKLTLVAIVLVPAVLVIARLLGKRIRRSAEGMLEKRANLLGRVQETVRALPVVQVYGQEQAERERFRHATSRVHAWVKRLARLEATSSPLLEVAAIAGTAPVMLLGGWLVLEGEMRPSHFVAIYAALAAMYAPLRKAVGASNRMQGGIAGASRILDSTRMEAEVREAADAVELPPLRESIRWDGVGVTYPDGRVALKGIDVSAPAGRTTAIVGPSGAGKTTLLHTLPRLLDPGTGAVRIDGRDVREGTLASLRGRMAIVTQDARLFGGTLAENVAYARPGATRKEIEAAGRAARVDEIVARLPDGWDTALPEGGAALSGGERQRVAIARAVLRDPEILLLDEPTSALDPENERLVAQALSELCRGRTTLVVAHRRATVEAADHVVVLRDGRVEAQGTPAEVAAKSATWRELFG